MERNANRVVAVEVRTGRIGYAVLEKPMRLIDFGASWFDSLPAAKSRLARLLQIHSPAILVLRKRTRTELRRNSSFARVANLVRKEASRLSVTVECLSGKKFAAFNERHSCRNKYEMAAFLATAFPETAWRLPPRRKAYDPEPRPLIYFDALAVGMAYMEIDGAKNP